MNEQKRRIVTEVARQIQKKMADDGKILTGGFLAYCVVNQITNESARLRAKDAYYAGAEHVFTTLMNALDPDTPDHEPTAADMQRMDKLWNEISAWQEEQKLKFAPSGGSA